MLREWMQLEKTEITDTGTRITGFVPFKALTSHIMRMQGIYAELLLADGRRISPDQRRKAYAMLRDISDFTGHEPEELKELTKYDLIAATGGDYFSLSDCSMDTAREYITHLIDFALQWDIPLQESALNRTDDIDRYLYACLLHRKCCLCGKPADRHHESAIGMGRNRQTVDDSDLPKIALCRIHHTEAHAMGIDSFRDRYKVYGILFNER